MERLLPGPVERAWAYLTESDKRAKWLAGGEFDLRVGGKIRLEFDNSKLPNDEEGLRELIPKGKDVLLTIVHRNLKPKDLALRVCGGWDVHTGILADLLNGVKPRPFWTTHDKLDPVYAAMG